MSAYLKKGIAVWILGFLTFLAFLNAFNAVLMWTLDSGDLEFEPYLVGQFTGKIQVRRYFWMSMVAAFVFLGCTAVVAFRKPPIDPDLVEMLAMIDNRVAANKKALEEGLEANRKSIETVETDLRERMEDQKRVNEKSFETLGASLESVRRETLDAVRKQGRGLQRVSRELSLAIEASSSGVAEEVLGALAKQEEVIRRVGRSSKRSMRTVEKAVADLAELKTRLETLEASLALPQPELTSHSSPEDVKGIGPRLAEELKVMGIMNVGEFLTADPAAIEERTRLTRETAERLQGTAQLLMIPGIDRTDVELLEKAGVTNRKELAERDPFELCRKLAEVVKTYVAEGRISESEKPTVEEVLSWIKLAKL
jgi:nucleotidyltransferase/DNA polymerase involved in DNA repair